MFFFGFFGVMSRQKELGQFKDTSCKSCGNVAVYNLIKIYNVFYLFFIPIFKWGNRYYAQCKTCNSIFQVEDNTGKEIEEGKLHNLSTDTMTLVYDSKKGNPFDQYASGVNAMHPQNDFNVGVNTNTNVNAENEKPVNPFAPGNNKRKGCIVCSSCGAEYEQSYKFCPDCGQKNNLHK